MPVYGYARASSDGQTLDAQLAALTAAGCETVFRETISGTRADRPQRTRMLAALARNDVLLVSRLDRLARSTRDLLDILDAIGKRGAAFRSLGEPWADTTAPHGRSVVTVLRGLAEFERGLIHARTSAGRKRVEARGQPMGRPPILTPRQRRDALSALATGTTTQAELARRFTVSQATISRLAKELDAAVPPAPVLDGDTEKAARTFLRHIEGRYPVKEVMLYGSRARGTHDADSDADLAVVLKGQGGERNRISGEMAEIAFDVLQETGVLVQALPLWEDELNRPERFSNPGLIAAIKRDGLRL